MSNSHHTALTPAALRTRALKLIRQCRGTLLIAAVLLCLFSWAADAAELYGEHAVRQATERIFALYEERNPKPENPDELLQWEQQQIVYAYFHADVSADAARTPWRLLGLGLEFSGFIFGAVVLLGLNRHLLSILRTGEPVPRYLLSGLPHAGRAIWLHLRIAACILGWSLLIVLLPYQALSRLGVVGELIAAFVSIIVTLWAGYHYALATLHLADDPQQIRSTTNYIDAGVADMSVFTLRSMLKTMWPVYGLHALELCMALAAAYVPALAIPVRILGIPVSLISTGMHIAVLACLYETIHQDISAPPAQPEA